MVMADLARSFARHVEMDWMAVSSYGSGTKSSGVVRILKDLDTDISGRHVLIVDEIIDTGLTLSLADLQPELAATRPSVEICTLLRKPEALQMPVDVQLRRLGHPQRVRGRLRPRLQEKYRNLRDIGTLAPHVYSVDRPGPRDWSADLSQAQRSRPGYAADRMSVVDGVYRRQFRRAPDGPGRSGGSRRVERSL